MKEFKIRAVEETSLVEYSKKLQSILNRMEIEGYTYDMQCSGVDPRWTGGAEKFLALVSGSRTKQVKETVLEEKEAE